jgi:MFS family permease
MRNLKEDHKGFSTILALALIPLSGFATDVYLPSLPAMAKDLNVSASAVQLTLVFFMFSLGVSQIFIGSILDSFGRFKINIASLAVFSIASFVIALVPDIYIIYAMRIIQGIAIAFIVIAKRAYFVDLFKGEKLKSYISLFSIIWASAPIIAPFLGGYLEHSFGWKSNFYFLGLLSFLILLLELRYSGETIKEFHPFKLKSISKTYSNMLQSADFTLGFVILGITFAIVIMFNLSSPFIIERIFGFSAITTGYSALLSGLSVMIGGITAKNMLQKPLTKKVGTAITIQLILALLMIFTSSLESNIYTLVIFTMGLNICGGFIYNIVLSYCLSRFSKNAGIASGLTGGGAYMVSALFSYSFVNLYTVKSQFLLGLANISLIVIVGIVFIVFNKHRIKNAVS